MVLLSSLGQKPRWSHVVELLSSLAPGADHFTFDEFCQLEARLDRMERQDRRRLNFQRAERPSALGPAGDSLAASPLLQERPPEVPTPIVRFTVTEEEFRAGAVVGGGVGEFKARAVLGSNG